MQQIYLTTTGLLVSIEGVGGRDITRDMAEMGLAEALQHLFPAAGSETGHVLPLFERMPADTGRDSGGQP